MLEPVAASGHITVRSAAAIDGAPLLISRFALLVLPLAGAGMVSGCTGMGVFFDHTTKWFDENPNTPAGSSETFQEIRGQPVDIPPLLPEKGNVWPENQAPDETLQDVEQQQSQQMKRGPTPAGNASTPSGNAPPLGGKSLGLPPPRIPPAPPSNLAKPAQPTPNGPAVNTTGGQRTQGYRGLGGSDPGGGDPGGGSVLIPNGNGTSTLIGPDGSVKTVPTKS